MDDTRKLFINVALVILKLPNTTVYISQALASSRNPLRIIVSAFLDRANEILYLSNAPGLYTGLANFINPLMQSAS